MAHLLGSSGAVKFIKAYEKDPSTPARNVLSQSAINANPELAAGSLQDLKNRRMKTSGMMAAGNTKVSAAPSMPLITPKSNTGQIDYFAINNQPQKIPTPPGQGTVLLPTPAPIMQPQKSPSVPYPVDGPRLPMSTSQYWGGGWVKSM
jgi:hypothetical protein